MKLIVPRHSYISIKKKAADFILEYNPNNLIPVPIEDIAEIDLDLFLIPVPGLKKITGTDGFISGDLKEIRVDEGLWNNNIQRTKFTIAHEIGHYILHQKVYESLKFGTEGEYIKFINEVDRDDYGWLEWQAYTFAGCVLVPPNLLEIRFQELKKNYNGNAFLRKEDILFLIVEQLSTEFDVSSQVIQKQLIKDELVKKDGSY